MPNCFQLTRISEKEKGPVSLNQIDRELCQLLGREEHPTRYTCGWYDRIGFDLAIGKTWGQIWEELAKDREYDEYNSDNGDVLRAVVDHYDALAKILHYLQANFTARHWVEIGRR